MTSTTPRAAKRDYVAGFALAAIHIGALGVFVPAFFSWNAVVLAVVLYGITGGLGITLCFHRLLTHRSMTVPKPVEYFLALCGTLALQGGPIDWVATHRAHHAHADEDLDPHDTHKGMGWAHMEWLWRSNHARIPESERPRWAADLLKDPGMRFLEKYHFVLQLVLMVALFAWGGMPFVIWGIFARLVFTYHCTWLVNSASHALGYRTYKTGDLSTNNWFVALVTFGEGWHNNHHAFPFSARHGMKWYEFDLTYTIIKMMKTVGLASNVKIPTPEMLDRLRLQETQAAQEQQAA